MSSTMSSNKFECAHDTVFRYATDVHGYYIIEAVLKNALPALDDSGLYAKVLGKDIGQVPMPDGSFTSLWDGLMLITHHAKMHLIQTYYGTYTNDSCMVVSVVDTHGRPDNVRVYMSVPMRKAHYDHLMYLLSNLLVSVIDWVRDDGGRIIPFEAVMQRFCNDETAAHFLAQEAAELEEEWDAYLAERYEERYEEDFPALGAPPPPTPAAAVSKKKNKKQSKVADAEEQEQEQEQGTKVSTKLSAYAPAWEPTTRA